MKSDSKKKKDKKKSGNIFVYAFAFLFLIAGIGIFSYPAISNYLEEKNHLEAISVYDKKAQEQSKEQLDSEWQDAKTYNENLAGDPVHDPFVPGSGYTIPDNYNEVLNINNDGMMGYIQIPSIKVNLPIYHTTTEEILQKGVGHIESTSLPVGGKGTHCVLTGHTGLPSAELFTRLTEVTKGDIFYIKVLNKTLAYKVVDINVVLPDELDNLVAEKDKDYVTLVTCTPYGKNTHRLLVKGERTKYDPSLVNKQKSKSSLFGGKYHYYIIGISIALVIIIIPLSVWLLIWKKRKKEKKDEEN